MQKSYPLEKAKCEDECYDYERLKAVVVVGGVMLVLVKYVIGKDIRMCIIGESSGNAFCRGR